MTSEYQESQNRAHAANLQLIEKKKSLEFDAQRGRDNLRDLMRDFDTHAPLKTAKEVSPVAHRIQLLMHMALELDTRGLEAVINCATFHRRYPKGA